VTFYRIDSAGERLTLVVHIQPNAPRSRAVGLHGDALKLQIAAPPADNKANIALIDFLHRWFKVPKRQIIIKQGARGRRKVVEIDNPGPEVRASLDAFLA
jgi:uncharacterized protein (TIGR00251 family)